MYAIHYTFKHCNIKVRHTIQGIHLRQYYAIQGVHLNIKTIYKVD